jgi:nitroreductase
MTVSSARDLSAVADYTAHMDVFEAVRTLLAVRGYQDKAVPEAVVRRIVEAGRLTGSG